MKAFIICLLLIASVDFNAQGCSDAGFCTLFNSSPWSSLIEERAKINSIRVGLAYGKTPANINVVQPFVEYSRAVNSKIAINAKMSFLSQSGNSIETGEISDVYLTSDFNLKPDFKVTTGFKIPFHQGNKSKKGVVLPMDYQPTLGTLDFLFGIQRKFNKLSLGTGIQIPLTQNANKFVSSQFISTEEFQTTNGFYRNPDLWLRMAYSFKFSNKFNFIPSILPIYHLADDSYLDLNSKRIKIVGSSGLTFNTSVQLDYKLNLNTIIGINGSLPLVVRKETPDGLARNYVFTFDLRKSF